MTKQLQYWSLVVGGKGVHNQLLLPRGAKKNKEGKRVLLKNGDVWNEYLPLHELTTRAVAEYSTKKEVLDVTDKKVKEVFNELKRLIKDSERFAVFYHSRNDPCSLCPQNHYHVVIGRDSKRKNSDLDHEYRYRQLRAAAKDDGPMGNRMVYSSYQRVNSLQNLIKYLSNSPRIFYGTNFSEFIKWYKEERGGQSVTTYDESFTEDCAADDLLGGEESGFDEYGFPAMDLLSDGDTGDFRDAGEASEFVQPDDDFADGNEPPAKRAKASAQSERDNYIERLINIIALIMFSCRSNDETQIRTIVDRRIRENIPGAKNQLARLKNAMFSKQKQRVWQAATGEYRARMKSLDWEGLLRWAWHSLAYDSDHKIYIPLDVSVRLLLEWPASYGYQPRKFFDEIKGVLNGDTGKMNTFFCMGASNAGKSVMFAKPLEYIMAAVGRIVSMNVPDRFVFEGCVGQRLVSIEECMIPKLHIEEVKKIMGGEDCQINVKYAREGALLTKMPVIATANQPPWTLEMQAEIPLRNRMHYYEFNRPFDPLAEWPGLQLDPRAYIVIWTRMNENSASGGLDLAGLFNDDILEHAVRQLDLKYKPEIPPEENPSNYKLYNGFAFDYKATDKDIVIVGEWQGLPVINPCLFNLSRCNKDEAVRYVVQGLSTDPSNFWHKWGVNMGDYRIICRFTNCLWGLPICRDPPNELPFADCRRFLNESDFAEMKCTPNFEKYLEDTRITDLAIENIGRREIELCANEQDEDIADFV
uniref:Nonstructural protein n=1 Tax=Parvoviridae sp. TaxID=1940570 RepID=A0A7D3UWE9_9VIRU|nr:MAG: nonstructural protein [Parvoviridae sp.]